MTSLQPFTRSITEDTCGPFRMIRSPLPPIFSTRYSQAIVPACVLLVSTVASAPFAAVSTATTTIPAACGSPDRRLDRFRVAGVEQDQVHAGRDEIVDLGVLLAKVVVEPDGGDLDVRVGLLRLELGAL